MKLVPEKAVRQTLAAKLLCVGLISILAVNASSTRLSAQSAASQLVEGVPVERVSVAKQSSFVASVIPKRRSIIGSAVDGRVVDLKVKVGQEVKRGQTMALLLTRMVELELDAAQAELALRQAELEEQINGARPEELVQAKARADAAEAYREYASTRIARLNQLSVARDVISQEEIDEAVSILEAATQTWIETKHAYDLLKAGTRVEQLAQSRAKVAQQQAVVEQIKDRLEKFTIRAPFDGLVVREWTENGQWAKAGDPIVEIIQIDKLELEVYVPENQIRYLDIGQKCPIFFSALPDAQVIGEIISIVPEADIKSRTFPVRVDIVNMRMESGRYLINAGMLAQVDLPTSASEESLVVPKDSLVLGIREPTVFVLRNGQAKSVRVSVGSPIGGSVAVQGDLAEGDIVITKGNERLKHGDAITVIEATSGKEIQSLVSHPGSIRGG